MAETILRYVLEKRIDALFTLIQMILLTIGPNLLELPPNLSGTDLLREKDLVFESVILIFRKYFQTKMLVDITSNTPFEAPFKLLVVKDVILFIVFACLKTKTITRYCPYT